MRSVPMSHKGFFDNVKIIKGTLRIYSSYLNKNAVIYRIRKFPYLNNLESVEVCSNIRTLKKVVTNQCFIITTNYNLYGCGYTVRLLV
jgi:hypothetical protein